MNYVSRHIPRISVALEERKAEHESMMVEVEVKIHDHCISILIDPGVGLSYINKKIVEICSLVMEKYKNPRLIS